MTIRTYWQIDPAVEPHRSEPALRLQLPGIVRDRRVPTQNRYDYYAQIGQAAVQTGFDGLFIRYRAEADESRIIAAAIAREVPSVEFVAEFPAAVGSAVYAAKQAVTFQRGTGNRFGWAVTQGADAASRQREGDYIEDGLLPERVKEFLKVARGVHGIRPFTLKGGHFEVKDGGFDAPLNRAAFPTVFLQGDSEDDLSLSACQADVHLFRANETSRLGHLIEALDDLAKRADRSPRFGLIQPIVAREFTDEAERDAKRSGVTEHTLVGSYDDVADRLAELAVLGVSHFVLSASPSLEEAYRVGQYVLPRLRTRLSSLRAAA